MESMYAYICKYINDLWKDIHKSYHFFFLAALRGLKDLISLTRDRTQAVKARPNHWTAREFPCSIF